MRNKLKQLLTEAQTHGDDPYWLGKARAYATALALLDEVTVHWKHKHKGAPAQHATFGALASEIVDDLQEQGARVEVRFPLDSNLIDYEVWYTK